MSALSFLSLSSLYCTHDYCICAIAVVGRFEFPHIRAEEGGKKKSGRKRRSAHLSIPRHGSNVVPLLVRKKDPRKKKGLRARMSSGVQLIEVHLCARPAARRSESAVRDNGGYGGVRGVYFHPSPSGSYSHRRTSDSARRGRGRWGLEGAWEDGH